SFNAATGTLTLTSAGATATATQFQAALRLVTYRNTSSNPSTAPRSVTYQVSDGSDLGNTVISTITVATVNDAPTLVGTSGLIFRERQATTPAINTGVVVSDVDSAMLAWATVRVSSNYSSGEDVLGFVANLHDAIPTCSFNSATGTLTLTSAGAT